MNKIVARIDRIIGRLQKAATDKVREDVEDYILSLKAACKLLYWDTYQSTPFLRQDLKVDNSKIAPRRLEMLRDLVSHSSRQVDVAALKAGKISKFRRSLKESIKGLKPVDEFAKEYTIYLASNSHIDLGWLWRWRETVHVCRGTFNNVLNIMKEFPDFTYSQSQAVAYRWMETGYPDIFNRIKEAVKQKRWELVDGMWVEPDCNLIGGESWARQLLYGKRYFNEKFGVDIKVCWVIDSFGYNWNMPQFLRKAGIDKFITPKIGWNDTNVFPYHLFWWEGPDGSRVLTYFPYKTYWYLVPFEFVDHLKQFEVNTGFKKMLILFGVGDHGGGPTPEMMREVEHLRRLPVYPRLEYISAGEYFRQFTEKDLNSLPVWKGELYLETHRGTYTTQAKIKEDNRRSENMLAQAECFCSFAALDGFDYPGKELTGAWLKTLFNQFHDILPGTSIRPVYQDAAEDHHEVQCASSTCLDKALRFLCRRIGTSGLKKGRPIVVFNSLSWPVSSLVEVTLDNKKTPVYVTDSQGKAIRSQQVSEPEGKSKVIFVPKDVPSMGYGCYQIVRGRTSGITGSGLKAGKYFLENNFLRVELDRKTGLIASIYDKKAGRDVLSRPEGNILQLLEDKPEQFEAWNTGLTGHIQEVRDLDDIEVIETGPVRAVIRLRRSFLGEAKSKVYLRSYKHTPGVEYPSSFFTQDIILYRDRRLVDFCTKVDWWEDRLLLKAAFPVSVRAAKATYEIPYGNIKRPTTMNNSREKAMYEVPAINWADLSGSDYGVSILSRSKYGYDIHGNLMRLTLLRAPVSSPEDPIPAPDPVTDRGKHTIWYALLPHIGDWSRAGVPKAGWEYNVPLKAVKAGRHKGKMAVSESFIQVTPANIILSAVKKAEDSNGLVLRLYESCGHATTARLRLLHEFKEVHVADILEMPQERIKQRDRQIEIKIAANEIVTLVVKF